MDNETKKILIKMKKLLNKINLKLDQIINDEQEINQKEAQEKFEKYLLELGQILVDLNN